MFKKIRDENFIKFSLLLLPIFLISGCFSFSFKSSVNNVWKVSDTDLSIAVEKEKASGAAKEFTRTMILRENYADKNKIALAKGLGDYSRINVYQIGENQYILKDVFENYSLDTQAKTLTKTAPGVLSLTFEDTKYPKFIGAFDNNENGSWRYIPVSERAEIPLTTITSGN